MNVENELKEMENLFLALADKTRLRLLNLMRENEVCVCFFTAVLSESQPKISRHLSYLRRAGIVAARRDGKWMHYRIETPKNQLAVRVLHDALRWLASQKEMQKDYEKLAIVCRAAKTPSKTAHLPKPNVFVKADINRHQSAKRKELDAFLL